MSPRPSSRRLPAGGCCYASALCSPAAQLWTLVDFTEITWHPQRGWLRVGSASAARASSTFPAAFSPLFPKRVGLMFQWPQAYSQAENFKKFIISFSPLQFSTDKHILLKSNLLLSRLFVSYTQIISSQSRPPARGLCYQINRKQCLPKTVRKWSLNGICPWLSRWQEMKIRG